jgi:hypothetical protein
MPYCSGRFPSSSRNRLAELFTLGLLRLNIFRFPILTTPITATTMKVFSGLAAHALAPLSLSSDNQNE